MKTKQQITILIGIFIMLFLSLNVTLAQETTRPEGWSDYSHSNDTDPVYEVVFPQDEVNTITITISPENWQAMQADMTNLFGEFGTQEERGNRLGGNQPPNGGVRPEGGPPANNGADGNQPPNGGVRPEGGPPANNGGFGGGNLSFSEEDPIWVTADITFEDETWTNVGFRYKGNSTLVGGWGSGSLKLGFKLNFDKFEDDYPEIDNQRFYGFDELSFSSNYRDTSYLHEKVAADLFRDAGIPSAQTAFYAVYMNYGEGDVYIGLYTAVEEIDDTVLDTQFSDNDGNLYKPEGTGAGFAAGTFDEASFEKKTNEDEADYSDILALFDALHDETRITDATMWRTNLESVLNVDEFVHWLAVNTLIQNWDTYGSMAHNYYLYNDPSTELLTWIPWDNNEALSAGGRNTTGDSLDLTTIGDEWPLISFLMNDPVYYDLYVTYLEETSQTVFNPEDMVGTYQTLHTLISPYVTGEATGSPDMELVSVDTFNNSLNQLIEHVNQRYTLAQQYID